MSGLVAGRYQIIRSLGRGRLGEVFEVKDLQVGERMALKRVHADLAGDSALLDKLRRTLALARAVNHPNVCRVFDVGFEEQPPFWTMELVAGETLAERIRRLGPAACLRLVSQIAAGLDAAHDAGLAHGALTSASVLVVGGERAVITDLGLGLDTLRGELDFRAACAGDVRSLTKIVAEMGTSAPGVPVRAGEVARTLASAARSRALGIAAAIGLAALAAGLAAGVLAARGRMPAGYVRARGCAYTGPVRLDLFTDRAAFLRAVGNARTVDFDDVDTTGPDPVPVAADRYRDRGLLIRAPGGQYVDDGFSYRKLRTRSLPNSYAAGPPGDLRVAPRSTEIAFSAGSRSACSAAFGLEFVGSNYAEPGDPALTLFDADGSVLAGDERFTSTAATLFRGFVAHDPEGRLQPVVARAQIVAGNQWPSSEHSNGTSITLDDLSFAPPVPAP